MTAIRLGTGHRDKRLAVIQRLLINVKDVPVVAPSLQPADDPCGEAVLRAGRIKNAGTVLAVQNAYGRDVDLAVCKSFITASTAGSSGRSAASSLTGR